MTAKIVRQRGFTKAIALRFSEVRLSTGVTVRYAEQGEPDVQPFIFLHGYTDSWFSFSGALARIDAAYRVFAPDRRGHGDLEQPQGEYAMKEFAEDVVVFMDACNIKSAVLVGHSMGSFIARRVARDAPERVSKLVRI